VDAAPPVGDAEGALVVAVEFVVLVEFVVPPVSLPPEHAAATTVSVTRSTMPANFFIDAFPLLA
jgi:hypothetical protein